MIEHRWLRITASANIPPREGRAVVVGGREIALFNLGPSTPLGTSPSTALGTPDRFLATDNRCPHQGGPLCDGIVTGTSVVCPLHAWKVSLASGAVERPANARDHCVATYPVRVEHGIVLIGLPMTAGADSTHQPTTTTVEAVA
jgi:nitrite reductase (NADH) small subunit